jgi:hypothetical protein
MTPLRRATVQMLRAQSRVTIVTRYVVGLALVAAALWLLVHLPPVDALGWIGRGGLLAAGLATVPGIGEPLYLAGRRMVRLVKLWRTPTARP